MIDTDTNELSVILLLSFRSVALKQVLQLVQAIESFALARNTVRLKATIINKRLQRIVVRYGWQLIEKRVFGEKKYIKPLNLQK